MDISEVFENRRRNLAALIQRPPFRGVQASFARHIQRSAPQVGQWLSGHRSISDESRDHIETACQLLSGWLDQPQHTGIALDYAPRVESPTIPAPPDIATALPVVVRALADAQIGKAAFEPATASADAQMRTGTDGISSCRALMLGPAQ